MDPITSIVASMLISGAAASDGHGCSERPHGSHDACACTRVVDFYGPWTGGGYTPPGGWPPPIHVPAGPAIHVSSPGYRVIGRPVHVAGPVVHIQGPPVYVDAPPIRIAPAQIYVQRPEVHVRPSEIMVEPPQVYFSDCEDGTVCTPVVGHGGGSGTGAHASAHAAPAAPTGDSAVLSSRMSPPAPPPPPPVPVYAPRQDRN
ncbi:hypothetical protein [Brevundimonas bacteroides]|uniref:hypothetical protein n=1 Tax=Brevundimonas bacteroides TaxID=74311 RepID=UPI00068A06FA|nr:hypothetical protein [Brevundimonas bacteroides]